MSASNLRPQQSLHRPMKKNCRITRTQYACNDTTEIPTNSFQNCPVRTQMKQQVRLLNSLFIYNKKACEHLERMICIQNSQEGISDIQGRIKAALALEPGEGKSS
ncbi:uncharacterized protein J3R85_002739 [Psidium guajava]|nr:uncharacterized protein J3R85_002739 [Psidium guajava]